VNRIEPKRARVRLDPECYEQLRQRMLCRDGWRCQSCGRMSNLEVHHQEFRSQSVADSHENLITLCDGMSLASAPDQKLVFRKN
jgi:5-methylcytosine-specific restriction endonuclease McrA